MTEAYNNTVGLCWTLAGRGDKTCCQTQPFSMPARAGTTTNLMTGASLGLFVFYFPFFVVYSWNKVRYELRSVPHYVETNCSMRSDFMAFIVNLCELEKLRLGRGENHN